MTLSDVSLSWSTLVVVLLTAVIFSVLFLMQTTLAISSLFAFIFHSKCTGFHFF